MLNNSSDKSGGTKVSFANSFWCGPVFTWVLLLSACFTVGAVRWEFRDNIINSSLVEGHEALLLLGVVLQLLAMMLSFIGCTSPMRGISAFLIIMVGPIFALILLVYGASHS